MFFTDPPTTTYSTLSLHDALPIFLFSVAPGRTDAHRVGDLAPVFAPAERDDSVQGRRHGGHRSEEHTSELQSPCISYAVFCLKKKITGNCDQFVRSVTSSS